MRLASWNVNGLRAALKKGFDESFAAIGADVFCIQETKCHEGQVSLDHPGYRSFFSSAEKKGYSGTAVLTRRDPLQVLHGIGLPYLDAEGRVCALEFPEFWLVNVYTPNAQNELARIGPRMEWDDAFRDFCVGLGQGVLPGGVVVERPEAAHPSDEPALFVAAVTAEGETAAPKPVVMCGDFNVAHQEIDLKNPGPNRGKAGFSDEERGKFSDLLDAGFADTYRRLHPDARGAYTWWSYRARARQNNTGWRIDYFLVSEEAADKVISADIYAEVMGSDHCPVAIEIEW